jgi:hypothetical protein
MDVIMLWLVGGGSAPATSMSACWPNAGFRLERVIPTASDASILEAVPA